MRERMRAHTHTHRGTRLGLHCAVQRVAPDGHGGGCGGEGFDGHHRLRLQLVHLRLPPQTRTSESYDRQIT
jgi:hypothetical protein